MLELQLVCGIVALIYVWLDTDGIREWAKVFRLKFFKYQEYETFQKSNYPAKDYATFLLLKHNNFLTRLVTCPYCLAVWLNIIGMCVINKWPNIGITIIGTWIGYVLVKFSTKYG